MKNSLIALAAFGAMTSIAHAQSSITLYGLIDASVGQTTREVTGTAKTRQTVVNSSGQNNSRWGLRGTEDIGSGLKAMFVLEGGFNTDTGSIAQTAAQGNTLFGRTALVGVSSGFGTVSLGRQYTAYDALRGVTDMIYSSNFATNPPVWGGTGIQDYQVRASNSIAYVSPNFSGISGAFVYGMGENKTATTDAENNASLHIKYVNGPLLVGYAHQREKQIANGANNYLAAGTATNAPGAPSTVTQTRKYNLLGASYDFGVAKLTGSYNNVKNETLKDKEFQFGVYVPFGAAVVSAGYSRSKSEGAGANNKGTGLSLLGTYALSKRTNLYAGGLQTKIESANAATTTKVSTLAVGVKHLF